MDRKKTPWVVVHGHRPMYCSSITLSHLSSRLGWPKQPDDTPPGAPPPPGYGDGFRAVGVEPPAWDGGVDGGGGGGGDGVGIPPCGVGDLLRNGMKTAAGGRRFALEPLMEEFEVDLYLCGHEHNYERLYPVLNGTFVKSYVAPGKPVHIVTGDGGAYGPDTFGGAGPWDAFRTNAWSYSDVLANQTHIVFRQRLATNSSVIDEFVLTRA